MEAGKKQKKKKERKKKNLLLSLSMSIIVGYILCYGGGDGGHPHPRHTVEGHDLGLLVL